MGRGEIGAGEVCCMEIKKHTPKITAYIRVYAICCYTMGRDKCSISFKYYSTTPFMVSISGAPSLPLLYTETVFTKGYTRLVGS